VLGQVVHRLQQASLVDIVVVTGGDRELIEAALYGIDARIVFNPQFMDDHMLISLQIGIQHLQDTTQAALVVLGDQPQLEIDVIDALVSFYTQHRPRLLVPSFQNRRGHPWLLDRKLWSDLLTQAPPLTLRQWLQDHSTEIEYLLVATDTIFRDLDTPEDYLREKPAC
jgi:molybdenum cofactor cytidylyltransferase